MARRTLHSGMAPSQAPGKRAAAVPPDRLRWRCDPELLGFASTDEVAPLEGTVGQERGLEAIALGLALEADGFNLYIAGPAGSGRTTTAQRMLTRVAGARSPAADWCYLHNFDEPSQPLAVKLATGRGPVLGTTWTT